MSYHPSQDFFVDDVLVWTSWFLEHEIKVMGVVKKVKDDQMQLEVSAVYVGDDGSPKMETTIRNYNPSLLRRMLPKILYRRRV